MSRYCAVESFKIGYFCEERTGFHLHEDLCHLRVLAADGREAAPGEPGEVVISNLVNHASVLLNYRLGDIATYSSEHLPVRAHAPYALRRARTRRGHAAAGERRPPPSRRRAFRVRGRPSGTRVPARPARAAALRAQADDRGRAAFSDARDRAVRRLRSLLGRDAVIEASTTTRISDVPSASRPASSVRSTRARSRTRSRRLAGRAGSAARLREPAPASTGAGGSCASAGRRPRASSRRGSRGRPRGRGSRAARDRTPLGSRIISSCWSTISSSGAHSSSSRAVVSQWRK